MRLKDSSRTFLKAPCYDHHSHSWNTIYLLSTLSGYGMPQSRISRSNPRQMFAQVKGARKALHSREGLQVWKVLYKTLSSAFTVYFRFYTCLIVAVKLYHDSFKFFFVFFFTLTKYNSTTLNCCSTNCFKTHYPSLNRVITALSSCLIFQEKTSIVTWKDKENHTRPHALLVMNRYC